MKKHQEEIKNRIEHLKKEATEIKFEIDKKLMQLENNCREIIALQAVLTNKEL